MSWTDERVALLKRLWCEGKTAAEIAKELGDVSRNAVIGKAHRLKLSNRVSPIQQNKKPVTPANKPQVQAAVPKTPKTPAQDNRQGIPLIDLKPHECRWPIGDPKEAGFGFCSGAALVGLPYCSEHAKLAYQAATRNRILKSEEAGADVTSEELAAARKVVNG
ncbi:MAG: gcrA cell cycle regulator family protein [Alphaproteobacteria bacterium]|nr:gcrA cell cycle regulator family protein [Alphaproteobacteria bacterium]